MQVKPVTRISVDGENRKLDNTPINKDLASMTSLMGELGVHPLSVSDNSGADVYEGEGLLNKSMGTPGIVVHQSATVA